MRTQIILAISIFIILTTCTVVYAADVKWSALVELTTVADNDVLCVIDTGGGGSKKITVLNFFDTIDTFAELNTIVADKTLVNEEDAVAWDALGTFNLGITITTGDPFTLGVVRWDDGSDQIDGEQIADDTIDDDSIDFTDLTLADFGLTATHDTDAELDALYEAELTNSAGLLAALSDETGTGVAVFSTSPTLVTPTLGTINSGVGTALTALNGENIQDNTIDVDSLDWGAFTDLGESGTVTWGNIAEGELADSTVISADIKNDTIDSDDYAADSIDNEHINWSDITYLSNTGKVIITDNESTAENNLILFAADANGAGNQILESDGDFYYTPSTGTVTTTQFVGGGAGLTALDGENITNDTIDNDSIDWGNMTDLTTDGAVVWGNLASGELTDSAVVLADLASAVYAKDLVTTAPITGAADNIFVGADSDVTVALTMLKDIVTTAPVTGAENDVLPGGDADLTIALDFTAAWNFGEADGSEWVNDAAPTTDAAGELALDTTITDHQPLWQYYDGGENMTIIAVDTAQLPAEDNEVVKYDAGSDKFVLEADASGGNTAWDDLGDPDAASVIDFGVHISQLDVNDFRIGATDDGNYVKWASGAVSFVGTASIDLPNDTVDSTELAAGSVDQAHFAVDVIGIDEMADVDHGDVAWSGGTASVESMNLGNATTGTYYVGLFADDTGTVRPIYADVPLSYTQATGTLAATEFSGGGASLTAIDAATGDSATDFFDAGEIVDARISDTLTSSSCTGTAAVATGVTCTDNENEALACPIIFVDGATGTQGAETDDTDFTYTPSTGTVTATEFVGGGVGLTGVTAAHTGTITWGGTSILESGVAFQFGDATDATLTHTYANTGTNVSIAYSTAAMAVTGSLTATNLSGTNTGDNTDAETGDSATAFFDAGTIEHEWGGLQADISAYTGLIAITGADTTAEIDSLDELEGQLADVTRIVSEAVMPVAATDPDVDASGELSVDTDGANEPNNVILRTSSVSGNQQYALAKVLKTINVTIMNPQDLDDSERDLCPIWPNSTGMVFTITEIRAWSDTDDTTLNVEVVTFTDWSGPTLVDALEIATNGTSVFYELETVISDATIAADEIITLDFDDTDDPGVVEISISGWFNADVD